MSLVDFVNGRCYFCGGTSDGRNRGPWCRGCGNLLGSSVGAPDGSSDAERVARLAAAYDADMPLADRRRLVSPAEGAGSGGD